MNSSLVFIVFSSVTSCYSPHCINLIIHKILKKSIFIKKSIIYALILRFIGTSWLANCGVNLSFEEIKKLLNLSVVLPRDSKIIKDIFLSIPRNITSTL
ncbi:MAG: hypothetical protein PG980_000965 [Wolbachia endosymbiont of Ctenocephalides felis wCfeJ]|nr:MAG: hypothetical protein PG980_000965 [Wolbachia endosymbiont of Ctenocephalides felis wCfeJ]